MERGEGGRMGVLEIGEGERAEPKDSGVTPTPSRGDEDLRVEELQIQ